MSTIHEDIKRELKKFSSQFGPVTIVSATVTNINEDDTIAVTLATGEEHDDVRLRSVVKAGNKIVITPSLNTTVLLGKIEDSDEYVVLEVEDISQVLIVIGSISLKITGEGIVMNGGSLGGLVKVENLTTDLNSIKTDLNNLKTAFNGWTPVPSDGGLALKTIVETWATNTINPTEQSNIEDTNIKH